MPRRILVIDDNEEILDLFHALLDDMDYEVIGSDFIEAGAIAKIHPDLLILDYLEGFHPVGGQIVSELKQQRATTSLPVIVCTTASMAKLERDPVLDTEGVVVVHKPFDVPVLLQTIESVLDKHAA
ncbi:MAG: response regulator [Chloroflexi bacterium]|nr:response regulator [Chloroflexota bacterium]